MPSSSADALERGQRLVVGDRHVAGAAAVAQVRVLGTGARVVEPGRDRVRLEDLAVLVLHDRRVGAVQHAAAAADGQRRAVAAGLDPLARGLDADQRDVRVVDERARTCRSRSSRRRRRRSRGRAAARRARGSGRAPRRRSRAAGRARAPGTAPGRRRADHVVGARRRW